MTAAQDRRGHTQGSHPVSAGTFAPRPTAVRAARQFVVEQLPGGGVADTAALLVSELATNAVEHARTDFTVRVVLADSLRVEVADRSPALPVRRQVPVQAERGRGLSIVDTLAARWGTSTTEDGKVVWFELPIDDPTSSET
jgi:anti-sigma regulatory factor (Ser/Thr protein kinase)